MDKDKKLASIGVCMILTAGIISHYHEMSAMVVLLSGVACVIIGIVASWLR